MSGKTVTDDRTEMSVALNLYDRTELSAMVELSVMIRFDPICPRQQCFSYIGVGLPGLNQY